MESKNHRGQVYLEIILVMILIVFLTLPAMRHIQSFQQSQSKYEFTKKETR